MPGLREQLLRPCRIVTERLLRPGFPARDVQVDRVAERRERERQARLLGHDMVDDLLAIDRERQRLAHTHVRERRALHLGLVQTPELKDGLHRPRYADDLHAAGLRFLDRFGADAHDGGLTRAHHREACALLRHEEQRHALELRRASPVRRCGFLPTYRRWDQSSALTSSPS